MDEHRKAMVITIMNHPCLGSAPHGYVVFEVQQGNPARGRDGWARMTVERNPHTNGEFRFPSSSVDVGAEPRLAQILDALDLALIQVAEDRRPKCVSSGCPATATTEVHWPGKTVLMCELCSWRARTVAEAMGFALETRPTAERDG